MLWEVEVRPATGQVDRDAARVLAECQALGMESVRTVASAKSFLIEADLNRDQIAQIASELLVDCVVEQHTIRQLSGPNGNPLSASSDGASAGQAANGRLLNVLFKPGVTNNVAQSTLAALTDSGLEVAAVATCRKYWINKDVPETELQRVANKVLANDAIERVLWGPLQINSITLGTDYQFQLVTVPLRQMDEQQLIRQSRADQLYLDLTEMQTVQAHFIEQRRDPTDIELETIAQTWSEHCSHKTLAGRIHYQDDRTDRHFENMLKETIFAATSAIRRQLAEDDWCVSVFRDNAGVVRFDENQDVCFKVETHNHPSALEPYGGANTGIGGVIRDPLGTGLGAKPICNTDVFCFAPPDLSVDELPSGVLHPKAVLRGVVAGVRDYGNRMGIPTVNGAIYFDTRYLGNPLVYCGNVALIPVGKSEKHIEPGDLIVAVGGRTGRDGIHGATFSSAELTHESETVSGGAVQIGNAITEKILTDVILEARNRNLYRAITDCGAGGFSSAVGEMGAECGAEVWLHQAPLKYAGLSYTEIWISEAQERMVLAVPPDKWKPFETLCISEGVEAAVIGEFCDTGRLVLKYHDHQVADLAMSFLHDGRPPVVREARFQPQLEREIPLPSKEQFDDDLKQILGSLNVCSKEWVIRQYDHEVQGGSVIKPLTGIEEDGPSDAAVVRPDLESDRGLVIACGMNPRYGDLDPYWMAASAIDEAVRNCVAVGADPKRIAILDNFCWGNTDRPETLGSLVRAALACHDIAIAYGTPFISGKDSLNNEFSFVDQQGRKQQVAIPPSLLISALGQIEDVRLAVSMDLKSPDNRLYLIGCTRNELGGSHFALVNGLCGGHVPHVDHRLAPKVFAALHAAIQQRLVRSCHDLSEGGLAVALAEMAFAGGFGAEIHLQAMAESHEQKDAVLLFSESNTRFLVEVPSECRQPFELLFDDLPCREIGHVTESDRLRIHGATGTPVIDASLCELKTAWKTPLELTL